MKASGDFMRGDRAFWHTARNDEPALIVDGVRVAPNDERGWEQTAGSRSGEAQDSLSRRREGERSAARGRAKMKPAWRIREAASLLNAKRKPVTPSSVARVMIVDDLRIKRYPYKSAKHRAANERYQRIARGVLPTLTLPRIIEPGGHADMLNDVYVAPPTRKLRSEVVVSPTTREKHRVEVRVEVKRTKRDTVARVARHTHTWRVSAKRQRRSCSCGCVERKLSGRWVPVQAKVVPVDVERAAVRLASVHGISIESARKRAAHVREVVAG